MKIWPLLAGTLVQEAYAQCNGEPIIDVTCHENLIVQLRVNRECLKERYPAVRPTELIISETGATQCTACTFAQPSTTNSTDPEYCSLEKKFTAYDFLIRPESNATDYGAVTYSDSDTPKYQSLWFKAGNCGSSMTIEGEEAVFETTIFKPPVIDPTTQIISTRTIIATEIICKYPRELTGYEMVPVTVLPDGGTNVVNSTVDVQDINKKAFNFTCSIEETGNTIDAGDTIAVGTRIDCGATTTDPIAITGFYLADCIAENAPGTTPRDPLVLIKDGCLQDLGDLEPSIDPKSPNPFRHDLFFNQFGFVNTTDPLTLSFTLTCGIKLGTAPTDAECLANGRRRREIQEIEVFETAEYSINLGENTNADTYDDIVVAHSVDGKSGDAQSDAVTNALALLTGTAIMLL